MRRGSAYNSNERCRDLVYLYAVTTSSIAISERYVRSTQDVYGNLEVSTRKHCSAFTERSTPFGYCIRRKLVGCWCRAERRRYGGATTSSSYVD